MSHNKLNWSKIELQVGSTCYKLDGNRARELGGFFHRATHATLLFLRNSFVLKI